MSFSAPIGLLLGALALPLVALYFLRIRRRRVRVSSLLPWHAMKRAERLASPFERFRRHLLLLLQLLLLAALVLAFARPFLRTEAAASRSVVLVLDTSASMGATDEEPTRLGRAVREATRLVDELGAVDEVMLVTAGPRTEVLVPFTRDKGAVRRALAALEGTEAGGQLRDALQLALSLARSRPEVEVAVLSDGGGQDLSTLPAGDTVVRYLRVGQGDLNAGIVALDLRRSPVSALDQQLFVTVQHFGSEPVQGSVEVYLDGALVGVPREPRSPEEPVGLVFDLPSESRGVLTVRLDVPGDLLPADDRAVAIVSPIGTREVLLVGGDALTARVLAADPRIRARRVAPSALTPELLAEADCLLLAAPVPDALDGVAFAILGPQHGGPVRFGEPVRAPRITGWQRSHPVLRFTRWDDVFVSQARRVADSAGLTSIVDGDSGPLVLAGERHGARVVQLAFDPLQSDLPLRVAWPVLLLNTVGWLTEDRAASGEASTLPTGQPFLKRLPEPDVAAAPRVDGPAGTVEATVAEGVLRVVGTDRVGIYEVAAGSTRWRFAANLMSESESRVRPRAGLGLGQGVEGTGQAALASARLELWRPLLWLALLVLVAEWAAWNLRRAA